MLPNIAVPMSPTKRMTLKMLGVYFIGVPPPIGLSNDSGVAGFCLLKIFGIMFRGLAAVVVHVRDTASPTIQTNVKNMAVASRWVSGLEVDFQVVFMRNAPTS